ncbi:PQQ-binding-like beta-propeller repeat protein [Natronococcus sp.]|uniref:PQQ-binding-like beta-propeller repeat protein n=1 Tax=Natronococcus sp. TaxID=35747 RepID=UPI0025CC65D4|nr:PQQ-binding-like beta-propeller repeat protein [Natronococcus sp.]
MSERTRREWLATVGAIGVAGCSSASNGSESDDEPTIDTTSPDGWPVAGRDVTNTRHSPADGPKNDVEPRWTFDGVSLEFDDPALAVADGAAYVGTESGQVRELDSKTGDGSTLVDLNDGEHRSDDVPIRAVTAAGDRLYLVSDGVYAVDAATGEELWTFEETALESGSGIETPAVVTDGTVYAGGYGLYAIDAASGEERWHFETETLPETADGFDGSVGWLVSSAPAVARGTVVFNTALSILYTVDVETGEEAWSLEGAGRLRGTPAVDVDAIYQAEDGGVSAIDLETGERRWRTEMSELFVRGSPTVANDTVYIVGGPLVGFDAETGEERWHVDPDSEYERTVTFGRTSPIATDETVYVAEDDRSAVFAVSVADETVRWSTEPTDGIGTHGGLALADGLVYAIRGDGTLVALEEG